MTIEVMNADDGVAAILGHDETFQPYFGATADSAEDPTTTAKTVAVKLNILLGLHHMVQIGGCINGDIIDLIDLMTPGLNFWMGYSSPAPKYAQDVCMPEVKRQHPEIFAVPLPADGNLHRFYAEMVERFGEMVVVTSIAKPLAQAA